MDGWMDISKQPSSYELRRGDHTVRAVHSCNSWLGKILNFPFIILGSVYRLRRYEDSQNR